jgi:dolichyl-phosphate beta-glucosyltransferase
VSYEAYRAWRDRPIDGPPSLSVVIPAYNESERILPTIGAISLHLSRTHEPWELIVSDDGSSDDTVELVRSLGLSNLRVLSASENRGKGSAVRRGVMFARGRDILFADADNSTPIEYIDALRRAIAQGADLAIGSRAAEGATESSKSRLRQLASGSIRWLAARALTLDVKDTQCGFKLLRAPVARELFSSTTIEGFSFDLELLYLAAKRGYRVAEIPVAWVDAPGSKVDVRKETHRFMRDLARIRANDLRGRYKRQVVT